MYVANIITIGTANEIAPGMWSGGRRQNTNTTIAGYDGRTSPRYRRSHDKNPSPWHTRNKYHYNSNNAVSTTIIVIMPSAQTVPIPKPIKPRKENKHRYYSTATYYSSVSQPVFSFNLSAPPPRGFVRRTFPLPQQSSDQPIQHATCRNHDD